MPRKPVRPKKPVAPGLNRRTFHHLILGFDWGLLDSDRRKVLAPPASDAALHALWREHGRLLLSWAAGEVELPELVSGHLCQYRRVEPCCETCSPGRHLPWALEAFGPPDN
jgi:hypothetical protein